MNTKVEIGELNFELTLPKNEEEKARFEIENDASMVFVDVDLAKAHELRDLLDQYITELEMKAHPLGGPEHEFYSI